MSTFAFVPLILLFPILGLLTNLVIGNKLDENWVGGIASGAAGLAFAVAVGMLVALLKTPDSDVILLVRASRRPRIYSNRSMEQSCQAGGAVFRSWKMATC